MSIETSPDTNVVIEADGCIAPKWLAPEYISIGHAWMKQQKEKGVAKPDFGAFKLEHGPEYETHPDFQDAKAAFNLCVSQFMARKRQRELEFPNAHKARLLRIKKKREELAAKRPEDHELEARLALEKRQRAKDAEEKRYALIDRFIGIVWVESKMEEGVVNPDFEAFKHEHGEAYRQHDEFLDAKEEFEFLGAKSEHETGDEMGTFGGFLKY